MLPERPMTGCSAGRAHSTRRRQTHRVRRHMRHRLGHRLGTCPMVGLLRHLGLRMVVVVRVTFRMMGGRR